MKDLMLNETDYNIAISNYDAQITVDTSRYVSQKLRIKLKHVLGEFYRDKTKGIDWFGEIAKKSPDIDLIEDIFKAEIMEISEVSEITDMELTYNNNTRTLTVEFKLTLVDGST
ncbi:MAG: hypothetical protein ACFFDT_04190, partial [Candidatus Hodarchaeota archaeon]